MTSNTSIHSGRWWEKDGQKIQCNLCPRHCRIKPGNRGFCFVRKATTTGIELTTYGRSSGFCIDPIEKKPLNHFFLALLFFLLELLDVILRVNSARTGIFLNQKRWIS